MGAKRRSPKAAGPPAPKTALVLIVRQRWCDEILDKGKVWELRGTQCHIMGRIWLAQSKAGGLVMGSVRLVGCKLVGVRDDAGDYGPPPGDAAGDFCFSKENLVHHKVPLAELGAMMRYKRVYAWLLADPQRFREPVPFNQAQGCIKWASLTPDRLLACTAMLAGIASPLCGPVPPQEDQECEGRVPGSSCSGGGASAHP